MYHLLIFTIQFLNNFLYKKWSRHILLYLRFHLCFSLFIIWLGVFGVIHSVFGHFRIFINLFPFFLHQKILHRLLVPLLEIFHLAQSISVLESPGIIEIVTDGVEVHSWPWVVLLSASNLPNNAFNLLSLILRKDFRIVRVQLVVRHLRANLTFSCSLAWFVYVVDGLVSCSNGWRKSMYGWAEDYSVIGFLNLL